MTAEDLRVFHRGHLASEELLVGVAGDATREEADALLGPVVDALPARAEPWSPPPLPEPGQGLDVLLVERPGRTQAHVGIARHAAPATSPDLVPLQVFNTAFGDTFSAPLVREIRERRGWSYGVDSVLLPGKDGGVHYMHYTPANEQVLDAIVLGLDLLDATIDRGPEPEDLEFARAWLVNHFPFHFDTAAKRLDMELQMILTGRTAEYLDRYVDRVREVDVEAAAAAARRHLAGRRVAVVVVGTPSLASSLERIPGLTRLRRVRYDHEGELPR